MKKETIFIAGLGNPDDKYAGTRHNMGFDAVDRLHADGGFGPWKKRRGALVASGQIGGAPVMLVKPQKYMNLSGEALQTVLAFYKAPAAHLIVLYDDVDLPTGQLRVRASGGAGTHNGMRNIILHLGEDFPRVRIGVGTPEHGDLADYVLSRPNGDERETLDAAVARAAECAEMIVREGVEHAMSRYNTKNGL